MRQSHSDQHDVAVLARMCIHELERAGHQLPLLAVLFIVFATSYRHTTSLAAGGTAWLDLVLCLISIPISFFHEFILQKTQGIQTPSYLHA